MLLCQKRAFKCLRTLEKVFARAQNSASVGRLPWLSEHLHECQLLSQASENAVKTVVEVTKFEFVRNGPVV